LAARSDELAPIFVELDSVVRQWSAMMKATPRGDRHVWNERFDGLARRKEELSAELSRRSAEFRAGSEEVRLEDVQGALGDAAVLVDYVEYWRLGQDPEQSGSVDLRRALAAFVIRDGRDVQAFDLGDAESIGQLVDQWRASYGQTADAQAAARVLREKLWEPLAGAIGDAQTVLVSPDGPLGRMAFAALPGKAPDTYLIEDYRLALVPVPRLIPALVHEDGDKPLDKELLLMGGVDYDRRDETAIATEPPADLLAVRRRRGAARATAGGLQWEALPGAGAEVAAIGELYRELGGLPVDAVADLRGAAATEENFRLFAPRCRLLHLATHGFFATENKESALDVADSDAARDDLLSDSPTVVEGFDPGLLSGLVMAGANDPVELPSDAAGFESLPEDGILMAEELAFLPLGGVQLAVLSACETGLGQAAGGEGLLGIQRAFQVAGARTTVATLWKVDDATTQRLMTAFYRNVLQGQQSYVDALRNAQIEILHELRQRPPSAQAEADPLRGVDDPADAAAAVRGAPYYWAAFTLSCDWR
jgi:CHAT domain-containing protein